jgi:hypothetical protein
MPKHVPTMHQINMKKLSEAFALNKRIKKYKPGEKVHPNLSKSKEGLAQIAANKLLAKKNRIKEQERLKKEGSTVQQRIERFSDQGEVQRVQDAVAAFKNSGKGKTEKVGGTIIDNKKKDGKGSKIKAKTKAKTEAQIIEEYEAEKTRQKNISSGGNTAFEEAKKKKDLANAAAGAQTKALEAANPAVVGKTRQDIRRGAKDDKKARRRAGRTAKQALKTPGGSITDEQNKANIAAEKAKIQQRREGRNQFLRNFGSQIVRGTNAPSRKEFDDSKSGMNFYNKNKESAADITKKADIDMNKYALDGIFQSDTDHTNNNMMSQLFGEAGNNPFTASFTQDSTPESEKEKLSKERGFIL